MKIREIVNEEVDMGWWRKVDSAFNPEALDYAKNEIKRTKKIRKHDSETPVYTKPQSDQKRFSTRPDKEEYKSPGYRGLVDVHVKSGHIGKKRGKKLITPSNQRSFPQR